MSMLTDEIADYLESRGVGVVGEDIYIDTLRFEVPTALVLQTAGGDAPDEYLDTLYQTISFISRNQETLLAYEKMGEVRDILHRGQNYDTPNFHIYYSHATGGIESMDRDIEGGMLYRMSIRFIYRQNNLIS